VLQERDALYRVASELAEDAAAENVRHFEVRYSPILHRRKRLAWDQIVDPVLAGLADAGRRHGMSTGVIICGIRSMDPKYSLRLAELALEYKNRGVLAFDLAGQEKTTRRRLTARIPARAQEQHQLHRPRGEAFGRRASATRSITAARTASGTGRGCARTPT
jgi:adenosine deaminase